MIRLISFLPDMAGPEPTGDRLNSAGAPFRLLQGHSTLPGIHRRNLQLSPCQSIFTPLFPTESGHHDVEDLRVRHEVMDTFRSRPIRHDGHFLRGVLIF
jgi:hypothetical protein